MVLSLEKISTLECELQKEPFFRHSWNSKDIQTTDISSPTDKLARPMLVAIEASVTCWLGCLRGKKAIRKVMVRLS